MTLSEANEVLGPFDLGMLMIAALVRFYAPTLVARSPVSK